MRVLSYLTVNDGQVLCPRTSAWEDAAGRCAACTDLQRGEETFIVCAPEVERPPSALRRIVTA